MEKDQNKNHSFNREKERITEETKKNPGKKKSFLLKAVLFFCFLFLFLISLYYAVIFLWAKNGVPLYVRNKIKARFYEYGLLVEAKEVRAVFPAGIKIRALSISPVKQYAFPEIRTDSFYMTFSPEQFFRKVLFPFHIQVKNGHLRLPLFPEKGKEGVEDILVLESFFLDVRGEKGLIRVNEFCGRSKGGDFTFSGTVNNLLHVIASRVGYLFNDFLWKQDPPWKKDESFFVHWMKSIPEELRMGLSIFSRSLRQVHQKDAWISFPEAKKGKKRARPLLKANFHIDLYDFKACTATAAFFLPECVAANTFSLGKSEQNYTLKNGVLVLEKTRIVSQNGSDLFLEGKYDENTGNLSGKLKGSCTLREILPLLNAPTREKLLALVENEKQDILLGISLHLVNCSLKNTAYEIILDISFPELHLYRNIVKKNSVRVRLTQEGFSGKGENILFYSAEKGSEKAPGKISFTFSGDEKKISAKFSGNISGEILHSFPRFSSWKNKEFCVEKKLRIPFQGNLLYENKTDLSGELRFLLPGFHSFGIRGDVLSAVVYFTPEKIKIKECNVSLAGSMHLSLSGTVLPGEKKMLLTLKSRGAPEKVFASLAPVYRKNMEEFAKELAWPKKDALMDSSAQLYLDYNKNPCQWFVEGNLVMADFQYRKIPFRYGATRFMLDSAGTLVLPGAVLETAQGKAVLRMCYKDRKEKSSSQILSSDGVLEFELMSNMNGNDVLRSLYPQWQSDFLNFPHPLNVTAAGVIDYRDEKATSFTARINNGECFWKKARLTDVECTVQYARELLTIRNASARTCGGTLKVDYHFDFNEEVEKGAIGIELKKADLTRLLKGMEAELKQVKGISAETTGKLTAKLAFDKKDNLLLFGKGNAVISGEDMWHIPVLGELFKYLGKAWHTTALGTITRFDMDFSLDKTSFRIDNGSSNGSVVALKTKGTYDWLSEEFDFYIRSELLKGTLPFAAMSKVLTPVSWILQKRIQGKGDSLTWKE